MNVPDEITCEQFTDMAPAYALAALEEAEQAACARHLAQPGRHRGCPEAVAETFQVTERLSAALPGRTPSPSVWRAIEARIADTPTEVSRRRPRLREMGGWFVAAAVIGYYFYNAPADTRRGAEASDGGRSAIREALRLVNAPGTRLVLFSARRAGAGRATMIVNPAQHRALLLADQIPPEAAPLLRLWGTRGPNVPTPLAPVSVVASDGIAAADLGSSLFEPTFPDHLVLSADGPSATSPGNVLLTAETR